MLHRQSESNFVDYFNADSEKIFFFFYFAHTNIRLGNGFFMLVFRIDRYRRSVYRLFLFSLFSLLVVSLSFTGKTFECFLFVSLCTLCWFCEQMAAGIDSRLSTEISARKTPLPKIRKFYFKLMFSLVLFEFGWKFDCTKWKKNQKKCKDWLSEGLALDFYRWLQKCGKIEET